MTKPRSTKLPPPMPLDEQIPPLATPRRRVPSTTPPPGTDVPALIRDLKYYVGAKFADLQTTLTNIEFEVKAHDRRLDDLRASIDEVHARAGKIEVGLADVRRKVAILERVVAATEAPAVPLPVKARRGSSSPSVR